ncbi:MAG: hypothetical protein QOG13_1786 [Sphingomonadales bacterium]|jgi:hypothetical protein|nr:hypothetical protein [Sphingomonadales bacterium]MEA3045215.1 hypothetical protein [Sphingomonadales bacterium]
MTPSFEFFFSFYGLLLGLSAAEVAKGLANALGARERIRIGWLTPMLAGFLLLDIASFWLFAWGGRALVTIGWTSLYVGLVIAITYYLAAALVFPNDLAQWESLDEHYWRRKRLVVAGLMLPNAIVFGLTMAFISAPIDHFRFWFDQSVYWGALTALLFTRDKRVDLVLLGILILQYAVNVGIPTSIMGRALTG